MDGRVAGERRGEERRKVRGDLVVGIQVQKAIRQWPVIV
jgi:hypothetical protein